VTIPKEDYARASAVALDDREELLRLDQLLQKAFGTEGG